MNMHIDTLIKHVSFFIPSFCILIYLHLPSVQNDYISIRLQYTRVFSYTQKLITGLESLGHKTIRYNDRGSVVCAIAQNQTGIYANADFRKAGDVVGF